MECGGSRMPSPAALVERLLKWVATCKACAPRLCWPLLFCDDRDQQGHVNVGVQMQLHLMFAGGANRPGRHAHFAACNRLSRLHRGLGDVRGADRAEELPFGTGLRLDLELEIFEFDRARLRPREFRVS